MDTSSLTCHAPTKCMAGRLLSKQIIAYCSDGEFHLVCDIARALDADMNHVGSRCYHIMREGCYQALGERRQAPRSAGLWAYRFVKGGRKIDIEALSAEVSPILAEGETLLNGHNVDYSKEAIKLAFAQLRKTIDRLAR